MKHLMPVFTLLLCLQSLPARADSYVGDAMPKNELILKNIKDSEHCWEGIFDIVGKFERSKNHWDIYYAYKDKKSGNTFWGNIMHLKKLDTNMWILECRNLKGEGWSAIQK